MSAALHVLALVQSAEVRFGVVWPEGPGAAAVKGFRGFSMHHLFLQGSVSVCCRGGAVVALLPQAELCPFSWAGVPCWENHTAGAESLPSLVLFLLDEACSQCLWFSLVFLLLFSMCLQ